MLSNWLPRLLRDKWTSLSPRTASDPLLGLASSSLNSGGGGGGSSSSASTSRSKFVPKRSSTAAVGGPGAPGGPAGPGSPGGPYRQMGEYCLCWTSVFKHLITSDHDYESQSTMYLIYESLKMENLPKEKTFCINYRQWLDFSHVKNAQTSLIQLRPANFLRRV